MIDILALDRAARRASLCKRLRDCMEELDELGCAFPAIHVDHAVALLSAGINVPPNPNALAAIDEPNFEVPFAAMEQLWC